MRNDSAAPLWSLVIGALFLTGCGQSPNTPPLNLPANPSAGAKDEDLIQGKWICVEYSEDGVRTPGGAGIRAVFTAKEAKIGSDKGAVAYEYKLHGDSSPKRCDLSMTDLGTRHVAYELKGDTLTIASHLAEDLDQPAPKSIEPAAGLSVSKFRRADMALAEAAKAKKPLTAEEEVALAVLRQQVASFRERFERKQYDELLAEMIAPDTRRKLQESPEEKAQFVARMKRMGDSFAKLLAAVESQTPLFNNSRSRASYDTRLIHFDGLPGMAQLTFQREGETWYMSDR